MRKKSLFDYEKIVGGEQLENIINIARPLAGLKVQHINSTKTGGGVAEILGNLDPMLNEIGIASEWSTITGDDHFFEITKKIHNSLHGRDEKLTSDDFAYYRETVSRQEKVLRPGQDIYVIHDPQPLPLIEKRKKFGGKWIWRCHIDLSTADKKVWKRISKFVGKFDAAIFHSPGYTQKIDIPQFVFPPTIDPLSDKNRKLSENKIEEVREKYGIPKDVFVLLQVGRFDLLKDPFGAVEAFKIVRDFFPVVLVLAGSFAGDDPEGESVYRQLAKIIGNEKKVFLLNIPVSSESPLEINALQRISDVALQMSIREGFGLTVCEALWKGVPVVARKSSGILMQVIHGINGFIVRNPRGAAFRINQLLSIKGMRDRMSKAAREYVRTNFLLPHLIQNWVCCFHAVRSSRLSGINEV
ncbi:MAG: glycosyltransferase [Elusimicrobia bacterium]|nr:glycosyltransferase [Elusimicrobiota bacterium]